MQEAITEEWAPRKADHQAYVAPVESVVLPFDRAEHLYVHDEYSNRYLDFSSGGLYNPVGHSNPWVGNAAREHLNYYYQAGPPGRYLTRWPVTFAGMLSNTFSTDASGRPQKVFFCESEEHAAREAVMMLRNAGETKILWIGEPPPWVYSYGIDHLPIDDESTNHLYLSDWDAVVITPIGETGHVVEPGFMREVASRLLELDKVVVFDERVSGLGRSGQMWLQHDLKLTADLTIVGGGAGGSLPFGALVGMPDLVDQYRPRISPQVGHPIACAMGANVLGQINAGLLEHVHDAGGTFADSLQELINQFGDYVEGHGGYGLFRTLRFCDSALAERFYVDSRKHGLLVDPPWENIIKMTPSLIISELEIQRGVDLISDVFLDWQDKYAASST